MFTQIKELEMNLTEVDMIKKIARHFVLDISRIVRIYMISHRGQFYDLLQEFDNTDYPRRP